MVFSSFTFLFLFLPLVLLSYYIIKSRFIRNIILFIFSLIFYAWGEPVYILLMIFSILANYFLARKIDKNTKNRKALLIIDVILNIGIITFFKYGDFLVQNINSLFKTNIASLNLPLPIGISFYTFQILSYVIDVYAKKVPVQKNIINLGMYITLFPQLIAGPIVRYETIENEINNRKENFFDVVYGTKRFIIGLGKKVIIANQMAIIADTIYASDISNAGTLLLWLAAISYTLQIYFDFSGYSDMAIGLGRIFGFHFLENFNYPYISKSITDFWRRWHISLSSWFRDYVYIPLGGNRVSKIKWLRNILLVWMLTGLWHGASWNFIFWGLYYGILLIIEKIFLSKLIEKLPGFIQHIYSLLLVIIGWIIFRIETIDQIFIVLKNMFTYHHTDVLNNIVFNTDIFAAIPFIFIGLICSLPILPKLKKLEKNHTISYNFFANAACSILFIISIAFLVKSTYNPFIYFRF